MEVTNMHMQQVMELLPRNKELVDNMLKVVHNGLLQMAHKYISVI